MFPYFKHILNKISGQSLYKKLKVKYLRTDGVHEH
jgi:hypothetical protein